MSDSDKPNVKRHKGDNVRYYYRIEPRSQRKSRKFKTKSQVYDVTLKPYDHPFKFTRELFVDMVNQLYKIDQVQPI